MEQVSQFGFANLWHIRKYVTFIGTEKYSYKQVVITKNADWQLYCVPIFKEENKKA